MLNINIFKPSVVTSLLVLSFVHGSYGMFYIVQKHMQSMYLCGTQGQECCENDEPIYELHSNLPGLIPESTDCTDNLGKYEATNYSGKIGSCEYGDFTGLGNTWAFCPTSYGGNLYLNGLHKVCGTLESYQVYECIQFPTCANYGEIVIACTDDTWYSGWYVLYLNQIQSYDINADSSDVEITCLLAQSQERRARGGWN